jgi:phosphoglycerate kinase
MLPGSGGACCLLENVRFYKSEEKNDDPAFARTLASYGDAYVNDAFGTCHRAHASVTGIPALFPSKLCGIGLLVEKELTNLDFGSDPKEDEEQDAGHGKKVCAAIIGGAKVSTKLPVIRGLLHSVDRVVLAGGLAFTFLKALGVPVGSSLVEADMVDTAKELLDEAMRDHKDIVLPIDNVCARSFPAAGVALSDSDVRTFDLTPGSSGIEDGWMGLDAGPKSLNRYRHVLADARKIVVNGPVGVFEHPPFDRGTRALFALLKDLTANGASTVVGGGDTVAALEAFGEASSVSYVSTGGGATLELLAGDVLPGVAAIPDFVDD